MHLFSVTPVSTWGVPREFLVWYIRSLIILSFVGHVWFLLHILPLPDHPPPASANSFKMWKPVQAHRLYKNMQWTGAGLWAILCQPLPQRLMSLKCQLSHLLAVWHWTSDLASLIIIFSIYQKGLVTTLLTIVLWERCKQMTTLSRISGIQLALNSGLLLLLICSWEFRACLD